MISGSNEQLQQELEYTILKPDFHSWRISKMQSRREDTLEERYAIKFWSVAFPPGQCTSPQLHPCHRLFDQDGHQDSSPISHCPDLAPCDFWLFPKLRGCRYETVEERKEAMLKVIDTLTQEEFHGADVGTVQQVHCSRRRLLQRGLEFRVCIINKSAHTKKVWKLI